MAYKKSEISSAHIIEAALRVLARQGYARTSLMDIAKEAGMSKGAVHYHFPTKEALISMVLETACSRVQERTMGVWDLSKSPLESVRTAFEQLWGVRASRSEEALVIADLLAQSISDEKLRPQLAEYYRLAATQVYEHLTNNVIPLGLRPKVAPQLLPRIIVGLLDGLMLQAFVDERALAPDDVISALETVAISLFDFEAPSG